MVQCKHSLTTVAVLNECCDIAVFRAVKIKKVDFFHNSKLIRDHCRVAVRRIDLAIEKWWNPRPNDVLVLTTLAAPTSSTHQPVSMINAA